MGDKKDRKRRKTKPAHNLDHLMAGTWKALAQDLRDLTEYPELGLEFERELDRHGAFRQVEWPGVMQAPPYLHKAVYQLKTFLKRYIFRHECSRDLNLEANQKFIATQIRVSKPMELSLASKGVIRMARGLVRQVLGNYDLEEHIKLCRFSTKATVGNGRNSSYIDEKLSQPLSGSQAHIEWFYKHILTEDPILYGIYADRYGDYVNGCGQDVLCSAVFSDVCRNLRTTNVPKAWDKLRPITPDTTIGSYYSSGLGRVLQDRLKDIRLSEKGLRGTQSKYRLDIRKLQEKHKRYAKDASVDLRYVTADLSEASNSFGADLINMLVPRKWYNVLKFGRVTHTMVGDKLVLQTSFMAMGIGFTFTLQTLLFWALLKAIQILTETHGRISVYGDDLIYPKGMHKVVEKLFPEMRLLLNADKTFCEHAFRESCGGDFYRGVDVRPCQPEGIGAMLYKAPFLSQVYKLLNTLNSRWDLDALPKTKDFLFAQIVALGEPIFQVPMDMPETSGFKVKEIIFSHPQPFSIPFYRKENAKGQAVNRWEFQCLRSMSRDRVVKYEQFYYWDVLRESYDQREVDLFSDDVGDRLRTIPVQPYVTVATYKGWNGQRVRLKKLVSVVDRRASSRELVVTGFTSEW